MARLLQQPAWQAGQPTAWHWSALQRDASCPREQLPSCGALPCQRCPLSWLPQLHLGTTCPTLCTDTLYWLPAEDIGGERRVQAITHQLLHLAVELLPAHGQE